MIVVEVNPNGELEDAFKEVVEPGTRALLVAADPPYFNQRVRLAALAVQYKIPALYAEREYEVAEWTFELRPEHLGRLSADWRFAGRILGGGQAPGAPGGVAAEMGLVINLKAAKALQLAIQPWLMARANKVIE